ncbi:hypothetical protein MXB_4523 [Myxobolus squamalis]|nr:hypothetical protein MXB_4523 [Myxobolus squamalis]
MKLDKKFQDSYTISYRPADDFGEKGYQIEDFKTNPHNLAMDFITDETEELKNNKDRKHKKYVNIEIPKVKKIKTESGILVDSTYATDIYKNWLNKTGIKSILNSKKSNYNVADKIKQISQQLTDKKFVEISNPQANIKPMKDKLKHNKAVKKSWNRKKN